MLKTVLSYIFVMHRTKQPCSPKGQKIYYVMTTTDYFVHTLYTLRNKQEVVLYAYERLIPAAEQQLAMDFLEQEYANECLGYPFEAPAFDGDAALWAAQTVYVASQLLLYRKDKEEDLPLVLPPYTGTVTPGAILSADICLRFLPDVLQMAKNIDVEDLLVTILTEHLQQWHYSAVGYKLNITISDFSAVLNDDCLTQLYVDRVIARKDQQLASINPLAALVKAAMGNYQTYFWNELQ